MNKEAGKERAKNEAVGLTLRPKRGETDPAVNAGHSYREQDPEVITAAMEGIESKTMGLMVARDSLERKHKDQNTGKPKKEIPSSNWDLSSSVWHNNAQMFGREFMNWYPNFDRLDPNMPMSASKRGSNSNSNLADLYQDSVVLSPNDKGRNQTAIGPLSERRRALRLDQSSLTLDNATSESKLASPFLTRTSARLHQSPATSSPTRWALTRLSRSPATSSPVRGTSSRLSHDAATTKSVGRVPEISMTPPAAYQLSGRLTQPSNCGHCKTDFRQIYPETSKRNVLRQFLRDKCETSRRNASRHLYKSYPCRRRQVFRYHSTN